MGPGCTHLRSLPLLRIGSLAPDQSEHLHGGFATEIAPWDAADLEVPAGGLGYALG